jgi:hypothetical protein
MNLLKKLLSITLLSLFVIVINTPKAEAVCYGKQCCNKSPAKELGFYNPKTAGAYFPPECCPGLETVTPASLGKDPVCKKKKKKPVVIIKKKKKKPAVIIKKKKKKPAVIKKAKKKTKRISKPKRLAKGSKKSTQIKPKGPKVTKFCQANIDFAFTIEGEDKKKYGLNGFQQVEQYSGYSDPVVIQRNACIKAYQWLEKNAKNHLIKARNGLCKSHSNLKGKKLNVYRIIASAKYLDPGYKTFKVPRGKKNPFLRYDGKKVPKHLKVINCP